MGKIKDQHTLALPFHTAGAPPTALSLTSTLPILDTPVGDVVNSVSGRALHAQLGIGRDFINWAADRIHELAFVEGEHFCKVDDTPKLANRETTQFSPLKKPKTDYIFTLDAAKHIAMVTKNDAGRMVRDYFIAAEKKLRDRNKAATAIDFRDPKQVTALLVQALEVVQEHEKTIETQKAIIAEQAPHSRFYKQYVGSDGMYSLMDTGRVLKQPPRKFIDRLVDAKYLFRAQSTKGPVAYQKYVDRGWFVIKTGLHDTRTGTKPHMQTLVTPRGLYGIAQEFGLHVLDSVLTLPSD